MVQRRNLSIGITVNLDNYENLRLEVSREVSGEEEAEDLVAYLDAILSRLGRGTPETAERVDSYRRRVLTRPAASVSPEGIPEIAALPGGVPGKPPSTPAPAPVKSPVRETSVVPHSVPSGKEPTETTKMTAPATQKSSPPPVSAKVERASPMAAPVTRKEVPPVIQKETLPPAVNKKAEAVSPAPAGQSPSPAPMVPEKSAPTPPATESKGALRGEEFSCERCGESITPVQRKLSRMFQNKDLCKKCLQQL